MGGAFTALTGDPAAGPFYNPASTVLISGSSLAATVNVYNKFNSTLGESADFAQAPQRLNQGYFRSLPASSATILNFKSFAFGLSILVPDFDLYSGQVKGDANTTSFLSQVDESLWAGGTFSVKLTERDSMGLSVYYTARNLTRSVSDKFISGGGTNAVFTHEEKKLTANSVVPIIGYQRVLSDRWRFGVSYRPPSLPVSGEGSFYREVTETNPFTTNVINRSSLRAVTKIPSRLGLGLAREVKGTYTASFDLQLYEGLSYNDLPELEAGSDQINHTQLYNFAFGYEHVVQPWLLARLGVFTNRSSHPPPGLIGGRREGDHVDMSGFSANFSIRKSNGTNFTFGGYYSAGTGTSTQIVSRQLTLVHKEKQVFTMLIASGFQF
jgi:hypothetical protein